MPSFGQRSLAELATCHPDLQRVANEAIKYWDFSILDGHRTQEEQETAFRTGRSKLHWPEGPHCKSPSEAFDFAPYPIDWSNEDRFLLLAGKIMGLAQQMGIRLRSGADWDGDGNPRNQTFNDRGHLELLP
jgi:peptidoglycan LD-endopeptidase CwlK